MALKPRASASVDLTTRLAEAVLGRRLLFAVGLPPLSTEGRTILTTGVLLGVLTGTVIVGVFALRLHSFDRNRRRLVARLERRAREEAALRRVAEALTGAVAVEDILRLIAETAVAATPADGAFVERLDRERGVVEVTEVAGTGTPPVGARAPYPGSLTGELVERRAPAFIPDIAAAAGTVAPHLAESCRGCSGVVISLISEGEALGALVLLRRPEGAAFQPDEVARAHTLADLASLALRRVLFLEESERRRRELERVMGSKARSIRGLSHDLKNPLGAVDGYAQLLEAGVQGELNPTQREWIGRIRASVRGMLDIIDDLLNLSGAEAGKLRIDIGLTDVAWVAREAAEEHLAAAQAAGLTLEAVIPEGLPATATDPGRVRQILGNLISNAIKYTPEGGRIFIRVEPCSEGAPWPGEWLCIRVEDTGPGIPEDQRERIFEEFSRLEPGSTHGAGLGLAISRRIARLLGGDITVESRVGQGSGFRLWLPRYLPEQASRERTA